MMKVSSSLTILLSLESAVAYAPHLLLVAASAFGLLLALGFALLGDLAGLLAGGVRVGPQGVRAGHAAVCAVSPCALVVAARFLALLLDGLGLLAGGGVSLLERQRPGAGVGLGVALGPRALSVAAGVIACFGAALAADQHLAVVLLPDLAVGGRQGEEQQRDHRHHGQAPLHPD